MNKGLLKKQIPTVAALLILFIGAGAGVFLVGRRTNFLPRAGPEHIPKQIQTTNVTDRSFSVSWVTDAPTTGFIRYGTSTNPDTTITDDRDQLTGQTGNYVVHHVTARGLNPQTSYYFEIGSGPSNSLFDNSGQPYQLTTGPTLGAPTDAETTYGTVMTPTQTPAEGSVVYLNIPGAALLSTLVKASGSWAIPLSNIRAVDLSSYYSYDPDTETINLQVLGPSANQTTSGSTTTSNDQPTPTITVGQDFDFTQDTDTSIDNSRTDTRTTLDTAPDSVELLNPSIDGEQLNSTQPEIQGQAPAGTRLKITVESPVTYEEEVIADEDGNFSWIPPDDLEPGEHTITLAYLDDNGIEQFLTRNFVVLAQGDSTLPALTSSPSGQTQTPTPAPTLAPTATPLVSPTPTPTVRTSQPATEAAIPVAGVPTPTIVLLTIGTGLIALGTLITRKIV